MLNHLIGAALQLLLFTAIPFAFYWLRTKQTKDYLSGAYPGGMGEMFS